MFPAHLAAQESATLRVLVTSGEDGSPIPGANTLLLSPDEEVREQEGFLHAGATDGDGFHEFSDVDPGRYLLEVTFIGHLTHRDTLMLASGERRIEQVTLSRDVEQLDELVVEAERDVTTGEAGLTRITEIDVARIPSPAVGGDLGSFLQTLPGVVTGGDRGGNLYIRGGTPYQNQVRVDNLRIVKPFHISNLYSTFPQEALQNVDLFAGGFGAEYTGATSAVLDVSLRPGNMREFAGNVSLGSDMASLQLEVPLEVDEQSLFLLGRKSLVDESSQFLTGERDPISFYDAMGRYSFQGEFINCSITGMHTGDSGQINPARQVDLTWSNTAFGGRCLGFDPIFAKPVEVTIGYTGFRNAEGSPDRTELNSSYSQQYLEVDHAFDAFGTILDYGFGVTFTKYEAQLAERFADLESYSDRSAVMRAYTSTELALHDQLDLRAGMATQFSITAYPTFEPRLRLSWRPDGTRNHEVSVAAGRYYQLTNALTDERDAGTVFAFLRPTGTGNTMQDALHGIFSYRMLLGDAFEATLEGYVKRHENIPVSEWNPDAQLEVNTALADGLTYGVDARLEYDRSPFYLSLGYGWSKVEYEAASGDLGAWIEDPVFRYSPPHDRRHKINSLASWEFAGFTASASWEFGTGRPYTKVFGFDLRLDLPEQHPLVDSGTGRTLFSQPFGARLPSYHRLDLSLSRSFELSASATIDAKIGMLNVYDRENIFYFDANLLQRVDQTPRLPYLSVQAQIN